MNQIHFSEQIVKMSVTAFKWMANDIYQVYIPSLKLSSYGPKNEAADEMMNFSLKEFVLDLEKVKNANVEFALSNLGWNRDSSEEESFSHISIDKEDVIQQLELKNIELIEETFSI
ncbi:hypothetical protein [Fluviicola sp.]|uniref:hypothetical protein n=1 Tax=Fluviicola sp. TaxID=1917219 RepID=UPI0031D1FB51